MLKHKIICLALLIHLSFYISASNTHWFDYLFSGNASHHCCQGLDFFQVPNGAYAYFKGGSLTGKMPAHIQPYWEYKLYSNTNVYHPLFTLLLGSFFILFPPLTSFYLWMYLKLFLTLWLIYYFYQQFKDNKHISFAVFFFLTNATQYLEIKISQYQFVANLFIFLLFINLAKNKNTITNGIYYSLSLLTKPFGLLWIPVLIIKKQYKTLIIGVMAFSLITLIFMLDNSGKYYVDNLLHNFLHPDGQGPTQIITLDALLRYTIPQAKHFMTFLKLLFLVTIILLSSSKRMSLLKGIYLAIVYYLLFYDRVYEYQYTTIIPIITICIIAFEEFNTKMARALIILIGLPSMFFFLRFFNIFIKYDKLFGTNLTFFGWEIVTIGKILPILLLTIAILIPDIKLIYKDLHINRPKQLKTTSTT